MKNIMNWKIFTESNKSSMSVDQLNDLEDYLYEFFGFDRENLDSDEIEKIKKRFDPTSKDFVDFLDSLDSNFDWFDYRMVPEIKDYINGIIHDYWEVDNNKETYDEFFDLGDLVDFGKWGKVYVIGFDDWGIKVTDNQQDRYKEFSESEFIIPDDDMDTIKIIEKGNKGESQSENEDDWWKQ